MLEVRATLDDGSRPLLQRGIYPFKEWGPNLHVQALFQGKFVRRVPKLGVLGQDRIDLLPEARVSAPRLVLRPVLRSFRQSKRRPGNLVSRREGFRRRLQLGTGVLRMSGKSGGRVGGLTGGGSGSRLSARGLFVVEAVNQGTYFRFWCCSRKVRICEEHWGKPMFFQTVSSLFEAGEVILGLSLTMFVAALIRTVSENARSRRR